MGSPAFDINGEGYAQFTSLNPFINSFPGYGVIFEFKFLTVSKVFCPVSFTCPASGITTPAIRATHIASKMIFTNISFIMDHPAN